MSIDIDRSRLTVDELAARFRGEMIPLSNKFSYFTTLPIAEEDLRQYLNDPISAISPVIVAALPRIGIILAPYLEKGNGKGDWITFERPAETKQLGCSRTDSGDLTILALSVKEIEVADVHYQFYSALASMVGETWPVEIQERFYRTIREELSAEVNGEVDERSWHLKQALLRTLVCRRKSACLRCQLFSSTSP